MILTDDSQQKGATNTTGRWNSSATAEAGTGIVKSISGQLASTKCLSVWGHSQFNHWRTANRQQAPMTTITRWPLRNLLLAPSKYLCLLRQYISIASASSTMNTRSKYKIQVQDPSTRSKHKSQAQIPSTRSKHKSQAQEPSKRTNHKNYGPRSLQCQLHLSLVI